MVKGRGLLGQRKWIDGIMEDMVNGLRGLADYKVGVEVIALNIKEKIDEEIQEIIDRLEIFNEDFEDVKNELQNLLDNLGKMDLRDWYFQLSSEANWLDKLSEEYHKFVKSLYEDSDIVIAKFKEKYKVDLDLIDKLLDNSLETLNRKELEHIYKYSSKLVANSIIYSSNQKNEKFTEYDCRARKEAYAIINEIYKKLKLRIKEYKKTQTRIKQDKKEAADKSYNIREMQKILKEKAYTFDRNGKGSHILLKNEIGETEVISQHGADIKKGLKHRYLKDIVI